MMFGPSLTRAATRRRRIGMVGRMSFRVLAVALLFAAAVAGGAWAAPAITPAPRIGEWLPGTGSATPLTVETFGRLSSAPAKALVRKFQSRLPRGVLPAEGYLLWNFRTSALA